MRRRVASVGGSLGLGIALHLFACVVSPRAAGADEPLRPRAAVVLIAAEGIDRFVTAYLSEVAAGALREEGFDVAPPNASREELARMSEDGLACANDDVCVSSFASRLGAPTLLFVEVAPTTEEHVRVSIATVTVRFAHIERAEPVTAEGTEAHMAEPVQAAARALARVERPCHVELDAAPGLSVSLVLGSSPPIRTFPLFLSAGLHTLVLRAPARADQTASLTCEAGHRYRVRVR